jgi:hypothetical protein
MSFLCSCARRRKNEDKDESYCYGKYSKYSSEVAPTPRVRRKFPGGVPVDPLPHAPSDCSIQKSSDFTGKNSFVVDNNNAPGSDSDIDDIEKTLLSICEQEEERLRQSEFISQLSESSESESRSDDDDVASVTSQDLEDLLVSADDPEDSSFSDDDDVSEEPVNHFMLRPRDTLRERYAEYSNEIWKDIQVSLIEAISSRQSGVQEREQTVDIFGDNRVEAASCHGEVTERRQPVSDDTARVFRAGRFQVAAVAEGNGALLRVCSR